MPVLGRNSGFPAGFQLSLMRSIKAKGSPALHLHPTSPQRPHHWGNGRCTNNDEWTSLMLFICSLLTLQSWKMRGQRREENVLILALGFLRATGPHSIRPHDRLVGTWCWLWSLVGFCCLINRYYVVVYSALKQAKLHSKSDYGVID